MTLGEKQRLFIRLIGQLIQFTYEQGYELTGGECYRTEEQQTIYCQQGKSRTMNSKHCQRTAMDFNLFINGVYQSKSEAYTPLGEYWESLHERCVWGGRWKRFVDGNHFEIT